MNIHVPHRREIAKSNQHLRKYFNIIFILLIACANYLFTTPALSATLDLVGKTEGERAGSSIFNKQNNSVWYHDKLLYSASRLNGCFAVVNGVEIWDVKNPHQPTLVNVIPNEIIPPGTLPFESINAAVDVKVFDSNSGKILIRTSESCNLRTIQNAVSIFNVDDPQNPQLLSNINLGVTNPLVKLILDINSIPSSNLNALNVFPFSQDGQDYLAIAADTYFQTFRIYDISNPSAPTLVGSFGAEDIFDAGVNNELSDIFRVLDALIWIFNFDRSLEDITINHDGSVAYLSNRNAGLITLDISDVTNPTLTSVALSPSPIDGVIFSNSAWMNQDDTIVVDVEWDVIGLEKFKPIRLTFGTGLSNTIPGYFISTVAGDDFEANQTNNNITATYNSIIVNSGALAGNDYGAPQGSGDQPFIDPNSSITANAIWIGQACNGDSILNQSEFNPGDIAVARRGNCSFSEKLINAFNLGASAIIIANNTLISTDYGGLRVWDFSSPTVPSLASTFFTECASTTDNSSPDCSDRNVYSAIKVIVSKSDEDDVDRLLAIVAWGHDGVVAVDITDPYNPFELARFKPENERIFFVDVHKDKNRPWIYATDNFGLIYILKLKGID